VTVDVPANQDWYDHTREYDMADVERERSLYLRICLGRSPRREKNRSKFVVESVRHELRTQTSRRASSILCRILIPKAPMLGEQGLEEWALSLPEEDSDGARRLQRRVRRFDGFAGEAG